MSLGIEQRSRWKPDETIMPNSKDKMARLDRQSCTGKDGQPKKNGAGGKGTWGALEDFTVAPAAMDKGDPNYDPHEHPKQTKPHA